MKTTRYVILGLVALLALPGASLPAAQPQVPGRVEQGRAYFSDVVLLNQYGAPMRFYTDLLQGKVVVIGSFFTTCTASCPVTMATFARIQQALGDRLDKDVHLIVLTVDPLTDTPQRLKEYADRLRAKPGWYFLTGKKENVDLALRKIGHHVADKDSHTNIVIIGNERTGLWKKAFSLAPPDQLVRLVEGVLENN